MKYTDENLMRSIEELFQKIRQQTFGGEDRGTPYTERKGLQAGRIVTQEERRFEDSSRDFIGRPPLMNMGREAMYVDRRIDGVTDRRPLLARERILRLIGEDEAISQNKLAAYLSIRPQSLSEMLVKLEKDGYISRTKNERDKRETLVSLTEEGKRRSKEVQSARAGQLSDFLSPLTQEEREQLFALIEKLIGIDNE